MEGAMPARTARAFPGVWPIAVVIAVALPLGLLVYFLVPPASSARLDDRVQHFTITTNVALLSAVISLLAARAAVEARHIPSLLTALGFMSLAGIFVVHGLATPGVLLVGEVDEIAASVVVALSAQLSLLVPALLFAARYSPVPAWLARSRVLSPVRLISAFALGILAYGAFGLGAPERMSALVEATTGYGTSSYGVGGYGGTYEEFGLWVVILGGGTIALFLYAAWRQAREFMRSRLPSHGALVIAFLLLAQTQIAMVLGPTFSLLFWEYHGLMASATILAVGSLFLELDRRRGLERFLPPNVVERVIVGDRLSLEGQRRTATILFTDLRGSTALAERATPEAAVATVNAYLRVMARAVIDEGGILDKFTGDGLMAIFGAMADTASGARAAARSAVRMRTDLAALNAERSARGEPTVGYGIGIHTGEVVLGAIGLPERSDYTAMGDTVNTAARMESLTKELGTDAVVSGTTAAHLADAIPVRPLGTVQVKGRSEPVEVFALV
jgi:class 3 adenylate cyclase